MNLQEITIRLEKLMPEFIEAQTNYSDFMYEWESKRAWWYRQEDVLGMKNAEVREANLQSFMENEENTPTGTTSMADLKMEISNKFYKLKAERDFLFEISKSLRIIEGAK